MITLRRGAYFVTICVQGRECLFGEVVDGEMHLNDAGRAVRSVWQELPQHYPGVDVDEFVVMPNHFHGLVILTGDIGVGAGPRACPQEGQPIAPGPRACPQEGQPQGVAPTISLPDVVHRFKSFTTARYRHGVTELGWPSFPGRLWQRNYYEYIIRDEADLNRIREYVAGNPAKWEEDEYHPNCRLRRCPRIPWPATGNNP